MAELSRKRGRYKEYMWHSNPYKFPAARRQKEGKRNLRNFHGLPTALHNLRRDHDLVFEDDVLIDDPVVTASTAVSLPEGCSDNNEQLFYNKDEVLNTDCGDLIANRQSDDTSEDELSDFTDHDSKLMYARYIKDDDVSSDIFSDNENCDSDSETIPEECETEDDDVLYSGAPITTTSSIVLILSFVMKYSLTREAARDLLAVIEAHCPRPNNCKKEVKKLFDFVSQAKGNIVKHFFCSYCKAYSGKGTQDNHGQTEVKGTCHICGNNLANTHGFFIEVPIVRQLQTFFRGECV